MHFHSRRLEALNVAKEAADNESSTRRCRLDRNRDRAKIVTHGKNRIISAAIRFRKTVFL